MKISPFMYLALENDLSPDDSTELACGYESDDKSWEVIVNYVGSLSGLKESYPFIEYVSLLGNYALLKIPESQVENVSDSPQIIYMEKPKRFIYDTYIGREASCISGIQSSGSEAFKGRSVYVAIIDSGIDYTHPDFRNDDGSTRIEYLWDQTVNSGSPPYNYRLGSLYDREAINRALMAPSLQESLAVCPSTDASGHGTHVAGIAAGNGRASGGIYSGAAPLSSLIIVKLAPANYNSFTSTTQIMQAVDFCVRTAIDRNMPIAINLSLGSSFGSHSGTSLLESYLDYVSDLYPCSIVAATGNEGDTGGHIGGSTYPARSELVISEYESALSLCIWKKYWDSINIRISAPDGTVVTGNPQLINSGDFYATSFSFQDTRLYLSGGGPVPYSPFQEICLEFFAEEDYILSGLWTIELLPLDIKDGSWDMWLPALPLRNADTLFSNSTPDISLTLPSTSSKLISVGAYDGLSSNLAAFSGRGYTWSTDFIKPDLLAPGVDVVSCAPGGGYTVKTGTSMAAPFVTGSAAVLMSWGIVEGNSPYMYGEKLKASLIKGSRLLPQIKKYPSPEAGWGTLCLRNSISV